MFEKALNAIITQRKLTTAETSQVRKSVAVSTTGIGDSGVVTEMEMRQALVSGTPAFFAAGHCKTSNVNEHLIILTS